MIQDYYLDKNSGLNIKEMYVKTKEEIQDLGITNIEIKRNTIIITLGRPGLFIGRAGENYNAFKEYLIKHKQNYKIELKETCFLSDLIPYESLDLDEDYM